MWRSELKCIAELMENREKCKKSIEGWNVLIRCVYTEDI